MTNVPVGSKGFPLVLTCLAWKGPYFWAMMKRGKITGRGEYSVTVEPTCSECVLYRLSVRDHERAQAFVASSVRS